MDDEEEDISEEEVENPLENAQNLQFSEPENSLDSQESVSKKKKIMKNPDVDTSFLPDREREEEERKLREELRQVIVVIGVFFRNLCLLIMYKISRLGALINLVKVFESLSNLLNFCSNP